MKTLFLLIIFAIGLAMTHTTHAQKQAVPQIDVSPTTPGIILKGDGRVLAAFNFVGVSIPWNINEVDFGVSFEEWLGSELFLPGLLPNLHVRFDESGMIFPLELIGNREFNKLKVRLNFPTGFRLKAHSLRTFSVKANPNSGWDTNDSISVEVTSIRGYPLEIQTLPIQRPAKVTTRVQGFRATMKSLEVQDINMPNGPAKRVRFEAEVLPHQVYYLQISTDLLIREKWNTLGSSLPPNSDRKVRRSWKTLWPVIPNSDYLTMIPILTPEHYGDGKMLFLRLVTLP